MIDKALLTGAFEKMGPERVQRMLGAFGRNRGARRLSYCTCALGTAAGYSIKDETNLYQRSLGRDIRKRLAGELGITESESVAIENCHFYGGESAKLLVALANEWLENRPASLRATSRETTGVGACRFGRGE